MSSVSDWGPIIGAFASAGWGWFSEALTTFNTAGIVLVSVLGALVLAVLVILLCCCCCCCLIALLICACGVCAVVCVALAFCGFCLCVLVAMLGGAVSACGCCCGAARGQEDTSGGFASENLASDSGDDEDPEIGDSNADYGDLELDDLELEADDDNAFHPPPLAAAEFRALQPGLAVPSDDSNDPRLAERAEPSRISVRKRTLNESDPFLVRPKSARVEPAAPTGRGALPTLQELERMVTVVVPKWTQGYPSTPDLQEEYRSFMRTRLEREAQWNAEFLALKKQFGL